MKYLRHAAIHHALMSLSGICLVMLGGCAFTDEDLRNIGRNEARSECRKVSDASVYLECMKRADRLHAKR